MRACPMHNLLFLFLLAVSSLALAQQMHCHLGTSVTIESKPSNWTTEKVETCDNGSLCQETILLIKSERVTMLFSLPQAKHDSHHSPFSLLSHHRAQDISFSNFCEESLCNNKENVFHFWKTPPNTSTMLHCPTCLALGSCTSVPSLPCHRYATRCYRGRIGLTGGINMTVDVRGCTDMTGCRLIAGLTRIGPISVKEKCLPQPALQPRRARSGAPWLLVSVWRLELLLSLLLVHFF
uniref:UPAR/Ly6 domain-containing protein n=1 Tax=Castor canadensis TaxID=51338 RepID=A0A8C0X4G4_CASCN